MLHKETAEEIFRDYPEQQDKIIGNLLVQFGMDSKGDNLENVRNQEGMNQERYARRREQDAEKT